MSYVSMVMRDVVRVIAIEVCEQLAAEQNASHKQCPLLRSTVLLQRSLHHHSNNLQLSKGLAIPGLLSDILEQIRIGSNINQYHLKFTTTFYVHTYVKGNIE